MRAEQACFKCRGRYKLRTGSARRLWRGRVVLGAGAATAVALPRWCSAVASLLSAARSTSYCSATRRTRRPGVNGCWRDRGSGVR